MTRRRRSYKKYKKQTNVPIFIVAAIVLMLLYFAKPNPAFIVYGVMGIFAIVLVVAILKVFKRKYRRSNEYLETIHINELAIMPPQKFERLIGWMFEHWGYHVTVTGRTGDHGLDLVLKKHGAIAVVQVKRYKKGKNVAEKDVRDLYGAMTHFGATEGFFVTTGGFTLPARLWAKSVPMQLIDGSELIEKLMNVNPSWRTILFSDALD